MTHRVSGEQLSALQFERVWVREATFLDADDDQQDVTAREHVGVGIQLEVGVAYSSQRDRAYVRVRASLEPPADHRFFKQLTAAVEGAFSIRGRIDPAKLEEFANVQAPVLLIPYLRQVITSLTAQSRVGAIVLPPLNMLEVTKAMQAKSGQAAETPAQQ